MDELEVKSVIGARAKEVADARKTKIEAHGAGVW